MITADELISRLGLVPYPTEGGYYAETYRSDERIERGSLPDHYDGDRALSTAIYYLLTADTTSRIHRLRSDEVFHFYLGDPVDMLQLRADGTGRLLTLGTDIDSGMLPQVLVPRGVWQGARLRPGGEFALLGTTVAPGFDLADYESGQQETLVAAYPEHRDLIIALTR